MSERCVSLQDVFPTLVELCGLQPVTNPEGWSLVPLLKEPGAEWSSTAITCFSDRNVSIRTERFRYIRYRDGQEELYDCVADPHEWTNQAASANFSAAIVGDDEHHPTLIFPVAESSERLWTEILNVQSEAGHRAAQTQVPTIAQLS